MISVVCPFYNEQGILEECVKEMLRCLDELPEEWELIIVNDGSTDESACIARELADRYPSVRLISYEQNRGRGHALLTGIRAASGDLIFTTEIDCSWGSDVVQRMYRALQENPNADMVIASPHLPGGGYRNVPLHRVVLSRYGNHIIRAGLSYRVTMNTGMTRGYRRDAIRSLALHEEGKEFHLEVVMKALALGMRIIEIPATLEWKDHKRDGAVVKRKSSSKLKKLIGSHFLFSVFAAPIRYLWSFSALSLVAGMASGAYAVWRLAASEPYAYALLGFVGFFILAVAFFSFGVISEQNRLLMRELWRLQSDLSEIRPKLQAKQSEAEDGRVVHS